MKKIALFVFNGDPMCFIHVLLNALDLDKNGHTAKIVIEGAATQLIPDLARAENPLHGLWKKAKAAKLIEGACKACATKMSTLEAAQSEGLALLDEMNGHPAMSTYLQDGFEVISF